MNDTLMIQTGINDENNLSNDKIQLDLKNQISSLKLVILSKNQDDIVVNYFYD
jgi:hypothetical protein